MKSSILQFTPGAKYRIEALRDSYSYLSQRLLSLGLIKGAVIEIANIAPFGGPIEVKCRGYNLSLRRDELAILTLTPFVI